MGHACLYTCLPRSAARTSLQARKKVTRYLSDEGFAPQTRFGGHCDYFSVGGHCSGYLTLLRLRDGHPRQFAKFWRLLKQCTTEKAAMSLFRKTYPAFQGESPFGRTNGSEFGCQDDAQIMDPPLFRQLKSGFSGKVTDSFHIYKPNVIFTDGPDDQDLWPKTAAEAAEFWGVVIDYHD